MKKILFGSFFLYCMLLTEILLVGRTADFSVGIGRYFALFANPFPCRTLFRYLCFFIRRRDLGSFLLGFANIGGNFLLFLPMGFFLPILFPRMRKQRSCFFTIVFIVLSAELLQGIFRVGVPDVDDVTVNMLGAYIGFGIFKKIYICRQALS